MPRVAGRYLSRGEAPPEPGGRYSVLLFSMPQDQREKVG